jgi:3-oxoacyl-[acyl-carrier-protein] synthase III
MQAVLQAIEYYLPERVLTNAELASIYPDWTADKIEEKTGIVERRIAADEECSSDLAAAAAKKLFDSGVCKPEEIDFILLCTQSPDYFLPTTACLLQHRLGIPTRAGALDFNLGCSGFVYGLSLAKGLIETSQAQRVLLLTAETYSKFIHPGDKSVRTLFGDGASATLITAMARTAAQNGCGIGPFCFGTDGNGARNLMVPEGGMRTRSSGAAGEAVADESGNVRASGNLYMDGPEIFAFTAAAVPKLVRELIERSGTSMEEVDFFVFHQANRFILDHLRRKLRIPEDKYWNCIRNCGNTVSSTIPIALRQAWESGRIHAGQRILLAGFGVGYSWAGAMIRLDLGNGAAG